MIFHEEKYLLCCWLWLLSIYSKQRKDEFRFYMFLPVQLVGDGIYNIYIYIYGPTIDKQTRVIFGYRFGTFPSSWP